MSKSGLVTLLTYRTPWWRFGNFYPPRTGFNSDATAANTGTYLPYLVLFTTRPVQFTGICNVSIHTHKPKKGSNKIKTWSTISHPTELLKSTTYYKVI